MTDYTIIKDDKIRTKICELMSDMLDSPDESGIYPTSKFMSKMEDFVLETRGMAVGWAFGEACASMDKGLDPRKYDQANLISRIKEDFA